MKKLIFLVLLLAVALFSACSAPTEPDNNQNVTYTPVPSATYILTPSESAPPPATTAPPSPETPTSFEGFHYARSRNGNYVWLGMTREEALAIEYITPSSFEENADRVLVSNDAGLGLRLNDNGLVAEILLIPTDDMQWSIHGGLAPTSPMLFTEVSEVFDTIYTPTPLAHSEPWYFHFSSDHRPVPASSLRAHYYIRFNPHFPSFNDVILTAISIHLIDY